MANETQNNIDQIEHLIRETTERGMTLLPVDGEGRPICKIKQFYTADYRIAAALRGDTQTFALRPDDNYIGIDFDIPDEDISRAARLWMEERFPGHIIRRCNPPKFAMVLTPADSTIGNAHSAAYYQEGDPSPFLQVEVCANSKLLTLAGTHRKTGKKYRCSPKLTKFDPEAVPVIDADQINELFDYIEELADNKYPNLKKHKRRPAGGAITNTATSATGEIVVDPDKVMDDISVNVLLTQVDGTRRQDWIRVGMALAYNYGGSQHGFEIWDRWSKQFPSYEEGCCEREWAGLIPNGTLTMQTIRHDIERERREDAASGLIETAIPPTPRNIITPPEQPVGAEVEPGVPLIPVAEIEKDIAAQRAKEEAWLRDNIVESKKILAGGDPVAYLLANTIYVTATNSVLMRERPGSIMPMTAFRSSFKPLKVQTGVDAKGNPIIEQATTVWESSPDKVVVNTVTMYPDTRRKILTIGGGTTVAWNTYSAPTYDDTVAPDPRHVQIFDSHMRYLFGSDDGEKTYEWVMNWFAHLVQFPAERPSTALFHIAHHTGTGRGWILELASAMLGRSNVASVPLEQLVDKSNKNGFMGDSLLVAVPEMEQVPDMSTKTIEENLKDVIDAKSMLIDRKYGSKQVEDVFARIFMMTNNADSLPLRRNNRRVTVIEHDKPPRSQAYYSQLYRLLDSKAFLQSVRNYLMSWKVSRDMAFTKLSTHAEAEIVSSAQNQEERILFGIDELLREGQWDKLSFSANKEVVPLTVELFKLATMVWRQIHPGTKNAVSRRSVANLRAAVANCPNMQIANVAGMQSVVGWTGEEPDVRKLRRTSPRQLEKLSIATRRTIKLAIMRHIESEPDDPIVDADLSNVLN